MKSLDIQIDEFKKNLVDVINKSELPICVVELILHSFNLEISQAVKINIENEKKAEEQMKKIEQTEQTEQTEQNQAKEE